MRHELFDELDAWNPRWKQEYPSLHRAVFACCTEDQVREGVPSIEDTYVAGLWADWLNTPDGEYYVENIKSIPDYAGAIKAMQEAEEASALPFKLNNIGKAPGAAS